MPVFYGNKHLTLEETCQVLGLVRQDALASLVEGVAESSPQAVFGQLDALFNQGIEPVQLLKEMTGYLRDLLLLAMCGGETKLVPAAGEPRRRMEAQSRALGGRRLQTMLQRLEQTIGASRYRGNSRFMAEACFAGLLLGEDGGTGHSAGGSAAAAGIGRAGTGGGNLASGGKRPGTAAVKTPPWEEAAVSPVQETAPRKAAAVNSEQRDSFRKEMSPALAKVTPEKEILPKGAASESSAGDGGGSGPVPGPGMGGSSLELTAAQWDAFLQRVKTKKITLHAFASAAAGKVLAGDVLQINFEQEKYKFHKERCEERENLELLKEAAREAFGRPLAVQIGFACKEETVDPIAKAIAMFGEDVVKLRD